MIHVKGSGADMNASVGQCEQEIAMEHQTSDELRRRADHYRHLARGPVPWAVAQQLAVMAEECEREASARPAERWRIA